MKPIQVKPVITRTNYETFKREAVNNWLAIGKSAQVVAEERGLKAERLYAWRKRFAPADAGRESAAGGKPRSYAGLQAQLDASMR